MNSITFNFTDESLFNGLFDLLQDLGAAFTFKRENLTITVAYENSETAYNYIKRKYNA